jgi:hypothetical protein
LLSNVLERDTSAAQQSTILPDNQAAERSRMSQWLYEPTERLMKGTP